ncbi:MAG: TolB-like translocation protein [Candidatus Dormibacteria bacterium]
MRVRALVALTLLGAACDGSPPALAPAAPCVPADPGSPGPAPVAVLASVAAGPGEYMVGVPGRRPRLLPPSLGTPQISGASIYLTVTPGAGSDQEIRRVDAGGCTRLAAGVLEGVGPAGKVMVRSQGARRDLVSLVGRPLADVGFPLFAFTYDSHLVVARSSLALNLLEIYDPDSGARTPVTLAACPTATPAPGRTPGRASPPPGPACGPATLLGPIGRSGLLVLQGNRTRVLDAAQGTLSDFDPRPLTPATGSPDGTWLAAVDPLLGTSILRRVGGAALPFSPPAPVRSLRWSADGSWLAVGTQVGGMVVHLPDGAVTDLGSLNVVDW